MQYPFSQITWQLPSQTNGLTKNGLSQSVSMHLAEFWLVVYTLRDDEIRLISARKATRHERQQYEEG
ncbi:BrnT family toxin [Chlorogloeopsis sp. ULAP01]|uniref:BrnT family toxin n=1 Tax=Chlorogloeopsis sp. ULAP01 TaxID=3056483 RepID=UPI0025AAE02B|nr:BrnT family toxin [Chlorogloeopsis sp. ULAP01]MDM9384827.1 BrnT family toxin [Chlorogloeopsis sp. ULAP01]